MAEPHTATDAHDDYVHGSQEIPEQEATFRLAETASAPLTARMTLAVEKFGKPLAA